MKLYTRIMTFVAVAGLILGAYTASLYSQATVSDARHYVLVGVVDPNGFAVNLAALEKSLVGASAPTIDSYSTAVVDCAAAINQVLVAAPGAGKSIWVYGFTGYANVAGTITFQDANDTALSGTIPLAAHGAFVLQPSGNFSQAWIKCTTNKALELDCATCTLDGIITYAVVTD